MVADGLDMAGEAAQGISLGPCGEAQPVTFIQISLDQRLQGGVRVSSTGTLEPVEDRHNGATA